MHIPAFISDLAVMMLTAGAITILFRKIKQPLILGYILAGFLTSPYFPLFMTVEDTEAIHIWSEIGIIFLMFHLGLEFNLHKLAQVGSTAIVTTIIEVAGMLAAGFGAGQLLGFGIMDSICLGGMLSMSSTTVIIKVFDELHLKGKKYTEMVFGTLVIQDIVGIFMMVILSTLSVRQNISGGQIVFSLGLMVLYLIIWLILGIYLLPTLLNRAIQYMNDEMLLVISVGICFGMVLLADWLGFSTALGAFLAGSLLAGTLHVERVEHLTKGVKDMFGAVFFLSVGMMVDPSMIARYAVPILVIIVVTLLGKLVFSALGMLLSGQNLENSVSGGLALAQIGEFAFIIASLGNKLGLISQFLYPIVVAVSVITTFTTPYCIKAAPYVVRWLENHLPDRLRAKLERYTSAEQQEEEQDSDWYAYIKKYFFRMT
ncbi:MAG: cation:proton antiporter, partial [Anaerovoracaceae bacterium]